LHNCLYKTFVSSVGMFGIHYFVRILLVIIYVILQTRSEPEMFPTILGQFCPFNIVDNTLNHECNIQEPYTQRDATRKAQGQSNDAAAFTW
jgi:hypothetical protein